MLRQTFTSIGNAVTQSVLGGLTIILQLQISYYSVYVPKIWRLIESIQSYCRPNEIGWFLAHSVFLASQRRYIGHNSSVVVNAQFLRLRAYSVALLWNSVFGLAVLKIFLCRPNIDDVIRLSDTIRLMCMFVCNAAGRTPVSNEHASRMLNSNNHAGKIIIAYTCHKWSNIETLRNC